MTMIKEHTSEVKEEWLSLTQETDVGLLGGPYLKGVPLPRIPSYRAPVRDSQLPQTATAALV